MSGYEILEPRAGTKPSSAIFLFHGDGTNVEKYRDFANIFAKKFPDALVVSMKGNKDADGGLSWTNFAHDSLQEAESSMRGDFSLRSVFNEKKSLSEIHESIDQILSKYDLDESKAALWGFSMGGTVASLVNCTRQKQFSAVVPQSSLFILPEQGVPTHANTLFIWGDKEEYATHKGVLSAEESFKRAKAAGVTDKEKFTLIDNMGHEINEGSLDAAFGFIGERLSTTRMPAIPDVPKGTIPQNR